MAEIRKRYPDIPRRVSGYNLDSLLPALRATPDDALVMADGFSCRTQIEQGDSAGRRALHLAEVLRAALDGDPARAGGWPGEAYGERPVSSPASYAALAGLGGAVAFGALGAARMVKRSRTNRWVRAAGRH